MSEHEQGIRPSPPGMPELDELQRGQERPLTVETLERSMPGRYSGIREVPVPDPGERPGALRPEPHAGADRRHGE